MEFFRVADVRTTEKDLQEQLTIENLPECCDSIPSVLEASGDCGKVFCIWGEFVVHREPINGGVRFSMPGCPNAMAWTVTTGYPPAPGQIVIHATISRLEIDEGLLESIHTFFDDWKEGLERLFQGKTASPGPDLNRSPFPMI